MTTKARWWDERRLTEGGLCFRIGPMHLYISRLDGEWQVAHRLSDETDSLTPGWEVEAIPAIPSDLEKIQRFASGRLAESLWVTPRAADRSVVARPRAPLHVLPGEESRFYVSAPVWVEIAVDQPPRALCELPTKQLSDTWFGSSTRDGEVAYALKTQARTRIEEIPVLASRAVTPVAISNQGEDLLLVERMNLPVPYLSIYSCERGLLWTEAVRLVRGEDNEMASFEVTAGPPREARNAEAVADPRVDSTGHPLVRAFGRLLRPFQEED